jgi:hypothetical protein
MCVTINSNCDSVKLQNVSLTDLWGRDMTLERNTMSWHGWNLCQAILKSFDAWQSYSPDTNEN